MWTETAKWLVGISKHTLAALFLCFLEKLSKEDDDRIPHLISKVDNMRATLKVTPYQLR